MLKITNWKIVKRGLWETEWGKYGEKGLGYEDCDRNLSAENQREHAWNLGENAKIEGNQSGNAGNQGRNLKITVEMT